MLVIDTLNNKIDSVALLWTVHKSPTTESQNSTWF